MTMAPDGGDADGNDGAPENDAGRLEEGAGDDQNPPRPSIRFALSTSTRHVPSLHDLDEDILEALYYDENESGDMMRDIARNIFAMREQQQPVGTQANGQNQDNNRNRRNNDGNYDDASGEGEGEYCFRGLEHMRDNSIVILRQQERDQVICDVLTEQERQRTDEEDGVAPSSAERLAAVSRASSTSARNRAILMGALDEAVMRRNRAADERLQQPPEEDAGDADNTDNNGRDGDGGSGGGGGGSGGSGGGNVDTLLRILGAAERLGLE